MKLQEKINDARTITEREQPDITEGVDGMVMFDHEGVSIINPWMSGCSRFEVDPYEVYPEQDVDKFIDLVVDIHHIEEVCGVNCRRIAAGVIEEILEQAGEDSWEGAADILDHALEGADSRDLDDTQVVRSVVLEIVSRHDPR
jgi:hypothetical protein